MEVPTWYILGRDSYQTYVEYEQDTQRIGAIGEVFPVIFFLVAALICLTTMTRMVEENRTQIGTLKALGYSKEAIALKYLSYAFLASIAGSVIGFIGGQKVLPVVIINAYGILYNNLPVIQSPIYASYSISSTLLAVAVTTLAAGISCYHELAEVPANLMRPEAPKNGKRILMERFTIVWKHMTFTQKATARNLFRYKKRFFMTVLGIGGCMGLLLVGFGLKDSIMAIGEKQFGEIRIYSSMLSLDEDKSAEVQNDVFELVQTDKDVITSMKALETSVDVGYKKSERSSYLVVASDPELFKKFVNLKDRNSQKMYELDDSGVVITEKLSKLLDVKEGDTIYLKDGDTRRLEVKVSHIVENYFFHYVYMTPTVYRELYEKEPEYTEIFTVNKQNDSAFEDSFQSRYMDVNGVLNVTFLSSMEERIADMLRSMDAIIYVIVIAAGLLAFVVLYNLNNINISERRRELATLKVLGFYDLEVSEYVFKENIFLTLIGAGFGVIFGLILHRFVILTAEIDLMMFGRSIKPISYLYSICLTCLFSFIVNMFMHFKLKKLDMVESMKSVE
ncbi:MAG: ABC transporter permease [Clostridia bacterium]|nr:ABC transporter permease [Clostridia bacterium]